MAEKGRIGRVLLGYLLMAMGAIGVGMVGETYTKYALIVFIPLSITGLCMVNRELIYAIRNKIELEIDWRFRKGWPF